MTDNLPVDAHSGIRNKPIGTQSINKNEKSGREAVFTANIIFHPLRSRVVRATLRKPGSDSFRQQIVCSVSDHCVISMSDRKWRDRLLHQNDLI